VRRALALVLLASGLKLLELPDIAMVSVLGAVVVLGPLLWWRARSRHGLPPRPRILRQALARRAASRADPPGDVPPTREKTDSSAASSAP
jgi:uncharacterized protein